MNCGLVGEELTAVDEIVSVPDYEVSAKRKCGAAGGASEREKGWRAGTTNKTLVFKKGRALSRSEPTHGKRSFSALARRCK